MQPACGCPLLPALLMLTLAHFSRSVHGASWLPRAASEKHRESEPSWDQRTVVDLASVGPATQAVLALRSARSAGIFPKDLNLKDKFIKHFTGSVTLSTECSKQFHRLYYNTRDCSIPAYYKRCARLLTRLAVSPLCIQT
ncbi:PREDICTED: protein FAM150A [Elephantulus edwardii]|uniref:protein FAM150A n=1 Tax=Elephantulus edwardii TaxID=28737 RepID=UPI0003F0EF17|nr:PREDICTED: protein FAM150A [Elephantulus edwardii]